MQRKMANNVEAMFFNKAVNTCSSVSLIACKPQNLLLL